jgi:hypothetical protein
MLAVLDVLFWLAPRVPLFSKSCPGYLISDLGVRLMDEEESWDRGFACWVWKWDGIR